MFKRKKKDKTVQIGFNEEIYKAVTEDERLPKKSQRTYLIQRQPDSEDGFVESIYIVTDMNISKDNLLSALTKLSIVAFNMLQLSNNDAYFDMYCTLLGVAEDYKKYGDKKIFFTELSYKITKHNEDCESCKKYYESVEAFDMMVEDTQFDWDNKVHTCEVYELYTTLDRLVTDMGECTLTKPDYKHAGYMHIGARKFTIGLQGAGDTDNPKIHVKFN